MNIKTKDIASKSGVSIATVSRYLNKSGYVKQETRELIKNAIQEIKKQENIYEKEKNIAVVFPDLSNMFFTDVLKGLTEEADKLNYNVFSFDSGESIEKEMKIIDALKDFNICGLIITTTIRNRETTKKHVQNLNSLGVPIILIDRDLIFCDFDGIFSDNKKGAFDGVDTLIAEGHKNIAVITGPLDYETAQLRLEGYKQAHKVNELEINESYIHEGDYQIDSGYNLTKEIINNNKDVTAIFSCNNMMTLGAINALNEMDIKIGEDISLLGFDDLEFFTYLGLNISVVSRQTSEMGKIAFEVLSKKILEEEPYATQNIVLKPSIVLRGSEKLINTNSKTEAK
ncbi:MULTISPECIES: LacI family DNA-binding transcriptional regulator [Paraclostridium]|uniref:LacI family transcriptional regulator n=1 Tax=Paraclostridium bifermentans TaxID=1490 RepID=A0A5P3XJU3_PARBF|nr:LacI family DNA-binding transcriptional regulator [Paraclostridium bifermentans]MDV8115284.1 LacI family DNA-binding transcriptional regulator [Bacillus sp. BAU-SS-2023]EQK39051.1 bacterial regulatory s, lacI family protein [[Clostridium] bifermentans ATCC 19299] [Paraclostridium bifermentans ATCC 19299]MCE9675347.1 LacI family transcriptional regulator [Paraclostridium bifermentans]QEZ70573.1 LacI family transcriptional regulator [Paraclostridium bifermentans]UOW66738.1 LacI family transcr